MIRDILKMGDERLLRIAPPVPEHLFGTAELQQLIDDVRASPRDFIARPASKELEVQP